MRASSRLARHVRQPAHTIGPIHVGKAWDRDALPHCNARPPRRVLLRLQGRARRVSFSKVGLRTSSEFLDGLRDNRRVHYKGRLLDDVLAEPDIRVAAERSAIAFDMQHDPAYRHLAVDDGADGEFSSMFSMPRSIEDLQRRADFIDVSTRLGGGMILLREVGADALFALLRVLEGESLERARRYYETCRSRDLAIAVAQTDVKGDRALPPHAQADPDLYVRVVDEDDDHIVVRGAKCHTSMSPYVDELLVLPTRAMGADDRDYAVGFAIPVDTPGLHLYASPYFSSPRNAFEHPLSSQFSLIETLTVFDDVVVPRDRVFIDRQPELAGPIALSFVEFHRFSAVMMKRAPMDLLVGAAHLVVEANGTARAGHVRDKLARLVLWAETVRGLGDLAVVRAAPDRLGVYVPDTLTANMAKYQYAHGYHEAVAILLDLAGGLLVTGPGGDDWDDPDTRAVLTKYFAGAVPAEQRLHIFNLISDFAVRDYGGHFAVVAAHAEGSLEAEKMQLLRSYSPKRAVDFTLRLGGATAAVGGELD